METYFPPQNDFVSNTSQNKAKTTYVFSALPRNIAIHVQGNELTVLHLIADYVFAYGQCSLSNYSISKILGLSRTTVNTAKKALVAKGVIIEVESGNRMASKCILNEAWMHKVSQPNLKTHRDFLADGEASAMDKWLDQKSIHSRSKTDPELDQKLIINKELRRTNKAFNSSVSSETGKLEIEIEKSNQESKAEKLPIAVLSGNPEKQLMHNYKVGDLVTDNVRRNIPDKPLPKIESNVFEIKEARKRGSLARARQIISALCSDSNYHQQSITGVASLILKEYSLDILEEIFADAYAQKKLGCLPWKPEIMLTTVKNYAS